MTVMFWKSKTQQVRQNSLWQQAKQKKHDNPPRARGEASTLFKENWVPEYFYYDLITWQTDKSGFQFEKRCAP